LKLRIASLTLLCLALAVIPASANTLYSNGALNGGYDAFTINFGYIVSDTFALSGASTVTGFDFYTWSAPGDTPQAVDWAITANENGGTVYGSGSGAALANTIISTNGYGYQINRDTVSGLNVNLGAGTYWLNLQNAVTSQGNPLYWDENDGKSLASDSGIGTIGSESFDILGGGSTTTTSTTPEPSSIMLFGSGILGLAGVLRRKLF
jgi:hypothetical protein